jgi:hypothetical protein
VGKASRAKKQRRETGVDPRRKRNPLGYVTHRQDVVTGKLEEPRPRWNGEPCEARRVLVVVAPWVDPDTGEVSEVAWSTRLAGTTRAAVEVRYGDQLFYLDDEPVDPADETEEMRRYRVERGLPFLRGSFGIGWEKVTKGMGLPNWAHRQLAISRVVSER